MVRGADDGTLWHIRNLAVMAARAADRLDEYVRQPGAPTNVSAWLWPCKTVMVPPPTQQQQTEQRYCLTHIAALFRAFCERAHRALTYEARFRDPNATDGLQTSALREMLPTPHDVLVPQGFMHNHLLQQKLCGFGEP